MPAIGGVVSGLAEIASIRTGRFLLRMLTLGWVARETPSGSYGARHFGVYRSKGHLHVGHMWCLGVGSFFWLLVFAIAIGVLQR